MSEGLDELRVLEESEAPTLSVAHEHSSAAVCEGAAFFSQ
jgi:hypothetical protein